MICLVILLVLVLQLMVVLFGKLLIFLLFVLCKIIEEKIFFNIGNFDIFFE